ncbi:hypothetical protein N7495_001544 [Penicillium taxi]|uniref:uncharacterized protein n=1 Tax=Penicillium taxi TaxID=168475 RepID=UPI002544F0E1|nr:uncharacterized protein N7495_001544 [Penicillium taxi]KAJ5908862.1 hypothetical protein N7495_001544 [Penicillium taxi]
MAILDKLFQVPYLVQGVCIGFVVLFIASFWDDISDEIPFTQVPLVGKSWWDFSNKKAKLRFTRAARGLIAEGFAKANVFQVMAASRPLILLHPKYIEEIKSHPHLDFDGATRKTFFDDRVAGFEAFHPAGAGQIVQDLVRIKLTQALGALTTPLSAETALILKQTFPPSEKWESCHFSRTVPLIVARLSTLVFMGNDICRNQEWLNVAVNYTTDAFMSARELRMWPSVLRPYVHWFMPSMKKLRNHLSTARSIVSDEIEKRTLINEGRLPSQHRTHPDALDWIEELEAKNPPARPIDKARLQVSLSMAAIHTTSNLITNLMYDLASYPEFVQPLREEICAVLAEDGGLKRTSLHKLKLMDSVMKETQRMHPVSMTSLNRLAVKAIPLSDGTVIPQGAQIAVANIVNQDETIYPHAAKYDGFRFYKKRQEPGNEHRHQFVTTSSDSFGFGHGTHACPGRFFASNEVKILVIHMLLKYDWQLKDSSNGRPRNFEMGAESVPSPIVELLFRSREPEVDLSCLGE